MNSSKITLSLFLLLGISMANGQQNTDETNVHEIKPFYDVLESSTSYDEITKWMSNSKFQPIKQTVETDNGYKITIESILQNEWSQIEVSNLKFEITEKDVILVSGELSGRKLIECEYVSSKFQHIWNLKNLNDSTKLTLNKQ